MTDAATRAKRLSHKERVLLLMSDGQWHSNVEICDPSIGGNRGVGRLWEAQREGLIVYEKKCIGVDEYAYRYVRVKPAEPVKQGALAL